MEGERTKQKKRQSTANNDTDNNTKLPASTTHANDYNAKSITVCFNNNNGGTEIWRMPPKKNREIDLLDNEKHHADDNDTKPYSLSSTIINPKSLIVRFNNSNNNETEIWRSPPTYNNNTTETDDNNDFIWSDGWIEVQRTATTTTTKDSVAQSNNGPKKCTIEFHAPHPIGKKGKPKICKSIKEVQKYIQQQQQHQKKTQSFTTKNNHNLSSPIPRRSSNRQRKSTLHFSSSSSSSSSSLCEGTQQELNTLLKQQQKNNLLTTKIHQSILYNAVLSRKTDSFHQTTTFLAANNKLYPDLRCAFGKHIKMKQCSLCKARVQGHWYCRITMGHWDRPDYDGGGNSAECLVELFRCSVEELQQKLYSLLPGAAAAAAAAKEEEETEIKSNQCIITNNTAATTTPKEVILLDNTNYAMDDMGEDILYHIASFIPTLPQLLSFCQTCKQIQKLFQTRSVFLEKLLGGIFVRAFGWEGTRGNFEKCLSWRERWSMVCGLRKRLVLGGGNDKISPKKRIPSLTMAAAAATNEERLRETVGVLLPREEEEAIFYDNLIDTRGFIDRAGVVPRCNGYFGMKILHLPPPPNYSGSSLNDDWQAPIVLCGDFNGIRIFQSLSEAVYYKQSSSASNADGDGGGVNNNDDDDDDNNQQSDRFISIGDGEGGGQVLSLLHCDFLNHEEEEEDHNQGSKKCLTAPCCFIGYASGRVAAVTASLNAQGDGYIFGISAEHHAHDSEVTALSFVTWSSSSSSSSLSSSSSSSSLRDNDTKKNNKKKKKKQVVLFSACCGGKVYFYPHACDPLQNFSMEKSVFAFSNLHDCPIFSMASSTVTHHSSNNNNVDDNDIDDDDDEEQSCSFSVICTGDRDGHIRVWLKPNVDLTELCNNNNNHEQQQPAYCKFRHVQSYNSSGQRGMGYHLVTRAMFIHDNILITGTNNGDCRFWQLQCSEEGSFSSSLRSSSSVKKKGGGVPLPHLTLRYDLMRIHNGAVEVMMNIGDILLTSGGNDGKLVGWDISTGLRLGSVRCHSGRYMEDGGDRKVYSCVVDVLLSGKDGHLISLCRDGSLRRFKWMM